MAREPRRSNSAFPTIIPGLRWWIGGMLFASTVINYIDRQTLSVLAPFLKEEYAWTNTDYAVIVISFRIAYAIGQSLLGRLVDYLGTRRGLTLSVLWYSVAAMFTSLAAGLKSFAVMRFLLGLGESANWPGATKAVSEWFPKRERGLAVALFDSGSSIGAAIAPALVLWLFHEFGTWRPVFLITGMLGFAWLGLWRWLYYVPETHPLLGKDERDMIFRERSSEKADQGSGSENPVSSASWRTLLRYRQTWGVIIARACTDPVWFFIADWFMIFLVSKGFSPGDTVLAFWIPFVAADLGNFAGGGVSSWLIRRGWRVGRARKAVIAFGAAGMTMLIPAAFLSDLYGIAALFAISTFAYTAYSTMVLVLPSDLFKSRSVASVSGLSGTAAGILTIAVTYVVGWVSDTYSFTPILIGGTILPVTAAILVMFLIRNTEDSGSGDLLEI